MNGCTVMRRKLVQRSELRPEWRDEPCGMPLFTDKEYESGICRSCAGRWTREHNYCIDPRFK